MVRAMKIWDNLDLEPEDQRVMREEEFHPIQHDPTVMSISANELLTGCNRILLVRKGTLGNLSAPLLHRVLFLRLVTFVRFFIRESVKSQWLRNGRKEADSPIQAA